MENKILNIFQKVALVYIFCDWLIRVGKYTEIEKLICCLLKPLNSLINAYFFCLTILNFVGEDIVIKINEHYKSIRTIGENSSLPP